MAAALFSQEWFESYKNAWNADTELTSALAKIGFNSVIAYGLEGEPAPRGFLRIENGSATEGALFNGETINWDLRASVETWQKWMVKPPGMMGLGTAYTTRKLKFVVGDYGAMIKDPRMAGPFIKSFSAMSAAC
jgi:hypothetical protein